MLLNFNNLNARIPIGKSGIRIKKKNKGKFTDYCGGKVTDSCIQKAKASGNPALVKRAVFAQNARKWSKHQNGGILSRYIGLLNNGIKPQTAFDTAHLSLIEDGRPNKYYSFGKRATNLNDWIHNATDSLTVGRYKNLQNVQNFNQFKQGLRQKNYNSRPAFYNIEINRGRNKNKQIVNEYNKEHGLPLITQLVTINPDLV